jgi:tRNA threonylcarbamoyladenosine biosynthesis protein TsaE
MSDNPPPADWTIDADSPEATARLAARLAEQLRGGERILLRGPLGSGKTFFADALGRALGAAGPFVSPTFVLLRSHPTPRGLTIHHFDFYRLEGDADLEAIDPDELIDERSIALIEWPERCPQAAADFTLELTFIVTGETSRRIEGRLGPLSDDRFSTIDP